MGQKDSRLDGLKRNLRSLIYNIEELTSQKLKELNRNLDVRAKEAMEGNTLQALKDITSELEEYAERLLHYGVNSETFETKEN